MNRRSRIAWLALVGLALLAALLRFYRLSAQDIWGDEAFSIALSSSPLGHVVAGAADTHPPLYPLLLFFWLRLAGPTSFATRSLSALIGIAAVPLLWVLARRLVPAQPRVAWISALLGAISPLLIYYSQETRMYELVAVLSLASMYWMLVAFPAHASMDARRRRGRILAYLVTTAAAIYTHYSAFFIVAAENLYFVIRWWGDWKRTCQVSERSKSANLAGLAGPWKRLRDWVLVQLVLIACYVPWILVQSAFLEGKASARVDEWSWSGFEMIFGKTLLAFGAGLTLAAPAIQIAGAMFLAFALVSLLRKPRVMFAPLCFIIPVSIAWLVNPIMPFFFERYVLVALPAFYVTVALGVDWLARHVPRPSGLVLGVGTLLVAISAASLFGYYSDDAYAKGRYGQMMAYVSGHAQPGDALILNNPLQKPLFEYYRPRGIPAFYLPDGAPLEDPATRQRLADIANQHSRLWLVMFGNPAEYDPTGYLERWLAVHAFKTYTQGYVDAALSLYVMPGPAASAIRHTFTLRVGDSIRLTGYDLDRTEVARGEALLLTLHWQATSRVDRSYKVFTHLIGSPNPATNSPVWAQMDGEPVGGSRPTTSWQVGESIDDLYGLQVPADAPPGEYELEVGMYDPATMQRLPVEDDKGVRLPDDRIVLGTVRIK